MEKEIKIISINDGTKKELINGNRHYAEEYEWAETMVTKYINVGYKIISVVPDFSPAINRIGNYTFYKTGFTVFLEREVHPENVYITEEDWCRNNMPEEEDFGFGYEEEFNYGEEFNFSDEG